MGTEEELDLGLAWTLVAQAVADDAQIAQDWRAHEGSMGRELWSVSMNPGYQMRFLSRDRAEAIARTRNNLARMAGQLRAALARVERLEAVAANAEPGPVKIDIADRDSWLSCVLLSSDSDLVAPAGLNSATTARLDAGDVVVEDWYRSLRGELVTDPESRIRLSPESARNLVRALPGLLAEVNPPGPEASRE